MVEQWQRIKILRAYPCRGASLENVAAARQVVLSKAYRLARSRFAHRTRRVRAMGDKQFHEVLVVPAENSICEQ